MFGLLGQVENLKNPKKSFLFSKKLVQPVSSDFWLLTSVRVSLPKSASMKTANQK